MGKKFLGDLFSKKVTKRRPIWPKSLLWGLSILKGDPFGNTALVGRVNIVGHDVTYLATDVACLATEVSYGY